MSIEIIIDDKTCKVAQGTTILEAAMTLGIDIPTLCYSQKESKLDSHSSSCSVCLVLNETDNVLVTACDTRIYKPIKISTQNDEVSIGIKQSLELLLSEHIGDCVGPCVIACPANIDIPEVLKQAWIGNQDKLLNLLCAYSEGSTFPCYECPAPCLKACRRKKIDQSVSVKNILIQLFEANQNKLKGLDLKPKRPREYNFNSLTGRIQNDEEKQFYLDASLEKRYQKSENAPPEAGVCMQCSCYARYKCELRDRAEESNANARTFRTAPRKQIPATQIYGKLVFHPGKCIHCRRCEVAAKGNNISPIPLTWFRGHKSVMNFKNADYDVQEAEKLAKSCPTGALEVNGYDF